MPAEDLSARLAEAEARAEFAEGELSALRDHCARWEAEKARADKAEAELAEAQHEVRQENYQKAELQAAIEAGEVARFAADVHRLVKDYSNEERGVIALMPFEATLDQLCLEKYGFNLDRVAALAVPESNTPALERQP